MDLAQRKADERKHNKVHYQQFTEPMKRKVKKLLKADLSPEQITDCCKLEGKERTGGKLYKLLCKPYHSWERGVNGHCFFFIEFLFRNLLIQKTPTQDYHHL
jgi:IS30 family transposase